jgi:hypothetical protein
MGRPFNTNTTHTNRIYNTQINLMCSRVVTSNLLKIVDEEGTDMVCIQETYVMRNKIAGIPRKQNLRNWGGKTPSSHFGHQ